MLTMSPRQTLQWSTPRSLKGHSKKMSLHSKERRCQLLLRWNFRQRRRFKMCLPFTEQQWLPSAFINKFYWGKCADPSCRGWNRSLRTQRLLSNNCCKSTTITINSVSSKRSWIQSSNQPLSGKMNGHLNSVFSKWRRITTKSHSMKLSWKSLATGTRSYCKSLARLNHCGWIYFSHHWWCSPFLCTNT